MSLSSPEFLGILSALCFAISLTLVKVGVKDSNPFTATALIAGTNSICFWILSIIFIPQEEILTRGLWPFIIDGAIITGLSRWLFYIGIASIGVSRSTSIVGGAPMFSALFAIALLGEAATTPILAGATCIVAGILLVSYLSEGAPWKMSGVILSLIVALTYGIAPIIRKSAYLMGAHALNGAATGFTSAFFFLYPVAALTGESGEFILKGRSALILGLACLFNLGAAITYFSALELGEVVVAAPLANSFPFFNLIIAYTFMRQSERINWKVGLGCLLILAGATAIITR